MTSTDIEMQAMDAIQTIVEERMPLQDKNDMTSKAETSSSNDRLVGLFFDILKQSLLFYYYL